MGMSLALSCHDSRSNGEWQAQMAEEPPVAGIAAADLAGEALVQEALQQEQLHSSPLRAPSPYR